MTSLGSRFALARLAINIPGIILIAFLLEKFIASKYRESIYRNIESMEV